ncbi:MAG: tetratricopeptide repeat protein [Cyanobacteria bacterium P01_C01_bin.89]
MAKLSEPNASGAKSNDLNGELVPEWTAVGQMWDLDRLCNELAKIKGQQGSGRGPSPLSPTEVTFLKGILFGANTKEIARAMGRQENGIKTDLSKTVYQYLKGLLGYSEGVRYPKEQVLRILRDRGYAQQPRPRSPQAPPQALDALKQVLPPAPANFVGRQEELDFLTSWLHSDRQGAALSVEGPGGIGKTALVQRSLVDFFESLGGDRESRTREVARLVFVTVGQQRLTSTKVRTPIGGILSFRQVLGEISRQVGISQESGIKLGEVTAHSKETGMVGEPTATGEDDGERGKDIGGEYGLNWEGLVCLNDALAAQPTVVFIDNGEELPRGALEQWLEMLPWAVTVIVASRKRLALGRRIDLQPLGDNAITQLVGQEAQHRGVKLSQEQQGQLVAVAQGMPLVVHYGLTQAALGLPLATVVTDLQDPQKDLVQFSVAPIVNQLWRSPGIQKLLLGFSRFPAGTTASAIYKVAGLDSDEGDRALGELIQNNLLQQREHRWVLWPLAQVYVEFLVTKGLRPGGGQDESTEESPPGTAFGAFDFEKFYQRWLDWGESWLQRYGDRDRWEWKDYETLDGQWGNLEKLVNWCVETNRLDGFWQMWPWLRGYTQMDGLSDQRKTWLQWASQGFEEREEWGKAAMAYFDLGYTHANSDTPEALATARTYYDRAWQWRDQCCLNTRGEVIVSQYRLAICQYREDGARRWLKLGRQLIEELGEMAEPLISTDGRPTKERLNAQLSYCEGEFHYRAKRWDESERCYQQARDAAIAINWKRAAILSEGWLGGLALQKGQVDKAERLIERTLQKAFDHGDYRCLALCQIGLAEVAQAQGRERRAATLASKALQRFRELDMRLEADHAIQFIKGLNRKPANLDLLLEGE